MLQKKKMKNNPYALLAFILFISKNAKEASLLFTADLLEVSYLHDSQ